MSLCELSYVNNAYVQNKINCCRFVNIHTIKNIDVSCRNINLIITVKVEEIITKLFIFLLGKKKYI